MKSLIITCTTLLVASGSAFGAQRCGVPSNASHYILGGDDAMPLEFPWQVSLQGADYFGLWRHGCGASIINESWILTAAHCVDKRLDGSIPMRALLGAHNLSRFEKTESGHPLDMRKDVYIHPMWSRVRYDYDYALIQLPRPLDFAREHSHLMPICLPKANEPRIFENMECVVSGWGVTKDTPNPADRPDVLQKLPVRVSVHEDCVRAYLHDGNPDGGPLHVTPRHICIVSKRGEGSGPCKGDSGGPLQCKVSGRYVLAGSTSFGKYCGSVSYPGIYARVTEVLSWIEKIMRTKTRRS